MQTRNILQGNSKWTLQAHSLIFRECNTDAMLQKAHILYNIFLLYCHPLYELQGIVLFILYPSLTMSNPLESLTYKNIKSHTSFTGWSGGTNSRCTKATIKNINMLLMYELTSLFLWKEGIRFSNED